MNDSSRRIIRKTILSFTSPFNTTDLYHRLETRFRIVNRPLINEVLDELCNSDAVEYSEIENDVWAYTVKTPINRESRFNEGAKYARDNILANIIGLQNDNGNPESEEYKALQKLFILIETNYGEMLKPYKG